jgi:hypothetical protein
MKYSDNIYNRKFASALTYYYERLPLSLSTKICYIDYVQGLYQSKPS